MKPSWHKPDIMLSTKLHRARQLSPGLKLLRTRLNSSRGLLASRSSMPLR